MWFTARIKGKGKTDWLNFTQSSSKSLERCGDVCIVFNSRLALFISALTAVMFLQMDVTEVT